MKKLSFLLMAMLMSVMSFAQTELFTQTYPGSPSSYTNAYTKSFTVTTGDYTLTYTNINNGQESNAWTAIRSGSKNGASVATIASKQIAAPIAKVVINFTQANAGSTNALYLEVSANSDFSSVTKIDADIAVGSVEFPIATPAANQYYKITIDQAKGSANGFNRFDKVVFYQGEAAGEDVEIVAAPEFSVTEANFTTAFTLDITSEEGTTLKYTIDNTDPSTSATAIEVATNSTSVQITKSTAVKAIAIKGELKSVTKSKVYCYVNSAETAYTVAEAMEVIDAGLGLANELYVKGEISEIEKFDANYGSITYWIKDEEGNKFECYSGLGLNKAKFTSVDDLVVGSKVVVCGVMKKFNTIYEFNYNNYIVSLELPVVSYVVTVSANPAEAGTVAGGGSFDENEEITVEAVANEGYEFVNWTVAGEEVSTDAEYTFSVTADLALVANFKEVVAEPTEVTVVVENMTKTIQSYGWMKQLTLDGEHETYGQVTLMASGCDGTYGTYAVIAWLGEDIELEGEGEWKNEGELDVLEVVVEDANGTVWNIIGKTDYVAPVEPVSMYADVEFTVDEEGILLVTGTTNDEVAVQLYVYGWNEVGYGTYGEGEVWGFIGDTEVANQQYTATIAQEGNVAYLSVILNDGEGNLYDLTAGGMALENPAAGAGSRTTVIVEEAEATVGTMFPEDLEIYGVSNDGREVLVTLWNGTVKKYGEYAEDFAVEVDWEQYDLVENTVATYSLEDGLAVFRAAVAAGKDTLDLVVSGAPWVDPATAEPTDTVTLAFTKGKINVSFDGTATIKGGNNDLGVQISTMGGDIYEGITSEQFNSYSSYLMIDWMQVKIYRGELKVVDLTNDVKVAYIGVLGADYKWYNITLTTADEIPTALDNINATVAPAKRINNGQLIIINNGVEYNAQGAIVK